MGVELPVVAAGLVPSGASPGDKAPNVRECTVINTGTGVWQVGCFDRTLGPDNSMIIPTNTTSNARITFGMIAPGPDFQVAAFDSAGAAIDVTFGFVVVRMPAIR